MQEAIEVTIASADGEVDCRLEQTNEDDTTVYSAVILYPHSANGMAMSKVYEHDLTLDRATGTYTFDNDAAIHPRVKLLERELSEAILKNK